MQIVEQFEMVDIEADDADIACARMPKIRSGLVEEGFFAKASMRGASMETRAKPVEPASPSRPAVDLSVTRVPF